MFNLQRNSEHNCNLHRGVLSSGPTWPGSPCRVSQSMNTDHWAQPTLPERTPGRVATRILKDGGTAQRTFRLGRLRAQFVRKCWALPMLPFLSSKLLRLLPPNRLRCMPPMHSRGVCWHRSRRVCLHRKQASNYS